MSAPDDELTLIEQRLLKLSPAKFRQIVAVLEDRRPEFGGRGAVDALMSKMRPRLVRLRPARKLTLQRIFCRPFEELLTNDAEPKGIGTLVPRRSIDPCWRIFVERADVKKLQKLSANLRAAGDDIRKVERTGRQLWAYAAELLHEILKPKRDGSPDPALGSLSERAYHDLLFMADYLQVADVLQELKRKLDRRPLRRVTEEHIEALVVAFEAINEVNRRHQHFIIDLLLVWLKSPSDIVAVIDRIAAVSRADVDESSLNLAGESLVEDVEEQLRSVTGLAAREDSRSAMVRELRSCIRDLLGAHGAFQNRSSPTAMRRLERIRGKVTELVEENVLKDADRRILNALPEPPQATALEWALSNVLPVLLLSEPPDAASMQAAEDQAVALRLCVKYAEDLGLKTAFFDKIETIGRSIEDRARWAAGRIDYNAMTEGSRASAQAHFYAAVRVLELVAGSDRADNLRRHLLPRLPAETASA